MAWAISRFIFGLTVPAVYQIPFIIGIRKFSHTFSDKGGNVYYWRIIKSTSTRNSSLPIASNCGRLRRIRKRFYNPRLSSLHSTKAAFCYLFLRRCRIAGNGRRRLSPCFTLREF